MQIRMMPISKHGNVIILLAAAATLFAQSDELSVKP